MITIIFIAILIVFLTLSQRKMGYFNLVILSGVVLNKYWNKEITNFLTTSNLTIPELTLSGIIGIVLILAPALLILTKNPKQENWIIRVKADKKFTREGSLILSEEKISMVDAALGAEIEVETIDGPLTMKVPAGTQSHTDFKLSGHGVPYLRNDKRGAHIVTIIVETPTRLSKKQKELLKEFKKSKKSLF